MEIIGLFLLRELDGWVFVELDVGSEGNADGAQIQEVLHTVVSSGSIGPYITSPWGFKFRRLGTGEPVLQTGVASPVPQTLAPLGVFTLSYHHPPQTGNSLHPEPEPACQSLYSLYLVGAQLFPLIGPIRLCPHRPSYMDSR